MGRSSSLVALQVPTSAALVAALVSCAWLFTACRSGDTPTVGSGSIDSIRVEGTDFIEVDGTAAAPEFVSLPGTDQRFSMVRVPGGTLRGEPITPFAIAAHEVTWDLYLAMVLENEGPPASKDGTPIDGFARPTKPYIATDRGFGQGQRPVISISARGAESFAQWLSLRTGRPFRLATEREWEWAARAGVATKWSCGDDPAALDRVAWHSGNSDMRTQVVGAKEPNAWGLFDMHGNVAEWCRVEDPGGERYGEHALRGGSFLDEVEGLAFTERELRDASWNRSDPQIPQSIWWLADAAWPGMRVVMDLE